MFQTALCQAIPLPTAPAGAAVPEWIHLLPAGAIRTQDGRGPYRADDAAGIIAASLQGDARLPIDENHSTDLAAPKGEPSPARGWIVGLQARADGIWGQVEWTEAGRALLGDKAYRHISPVIAHLKDGRVTGILRASLVNRPNLRGLTALHQESDMDLLADLRQALGLPEADEATAVARVKELATSVSTHATQLAPIAEAAGLAKDAGAAAILGAVQQLRDPAKVVPADQVTALQAELTGVKGELTTLRGGIAKEKAEAAVDGAIRAGKVGVKPLRDHYISRHMQDPAAVDRELAAMPSLQAPRPGDPAAIPPKDGKPGMDAEEGRIVAMMGIDPAKYLETKAAQAKTEEAL